jgi:hypothetical protein
MLMISTNPSRLFLKLSGTKRGMPALNSLSEREKTPVAIISKYSRKAG